MSLVCSQTLPPLPSPSRTSATRALRVFGRMMKYPEGPNDERAKFPGLVWKYTREQVAQLTSFQAKSAGTLAEENMKLMGINWVTFDGKRIEYRPAIPG